VTVCASEQLALELDQVEDPQLGHMPQPRTSSYEDVVAERLRIFLEHRDRTGGVFDPEGPIPY
jgi:hypothetical protein